jgi:hypothetical protein
MDFSLSCSKGMAKEQSFNFNIEAMSCMWTSIQFHWISCAEDPDHDLEEAAFITKQVTKRVSAH